MSLDPILVVEAHAGHAIGRCTAVSGLTVTYAGQSGTIDYVHTDHLNLSTGKNVYPGQHPGSWPKVIRTNLDFIRGDNWPTAEGDVEYQGDDNSGTQTLSKVTYLDGGGSPQTPS